MDLDIEQAKLIAAGGVDGTVPVQTRKYFAEKVVPTLEAVRSRIPSFGDLSATEGLYPFSATDRQSGIDDVYNRALHLPSYQELESTSAYFGLGGLDVASIQGRWLSSSPRIVVVDNILSERALSKVRRLLAESTVFYQTKMPEKFGGYVGAYIDDGLHQRLLLGLSFALHKQLPLIFKGHDLRYSKRHRLHSFKHFFLSKSDFISVLAQCGLTNMPPTMVA